MKELIKEAKKCKDCTEWLHRCNSECCKVYRIHVGKYFNPDVLKTTNKYLKCDFDKPKTKDEKNYFKWHGAIVRRNDMLVRIKDITLEGENLVINRVCAQLNEKGLCSVHGTKKKPKMCNELDENNLNNKKFNVTPNCLYKYKAMEVKE